MASEMPWFSFHGGHSGQFCAHARDPLEAIVQRAIELGFTHYGLSEHCPRFEESALYPEELPLGVAGLAARFEAYVQEARRLRDLYADRIELLIGYETEKLPLDRWALEMNRLDSQHGFEYRVGSVHDLDGRWIDHSPALSARIAESCGGHVPMQQRYFDSLAELVTQLEPEIVGHFDLVRKFEGMGWRFDERVTPQIEAALEAVLAAGSRLDVNAGAYRAGLSPVYPLPEILARARRMGIGVTLGDDGHGVGTVGVGLDACVRAIERAGYRRVDYLTRGERRARWVSAELGELRPG